ncbi:hypothetical protein TNCV_1897031 [Trichonephila clavipes]|nr:hypothetical protein TNCV_1897031 [Trichonephila clavipes]
MTSVFFNAENASNLGKFTKRHNARILTGMDFKDQNARTNNAGRLNFKHTEAWACLKSLGARNYVPWSTSRREIRIWYPIREVPITLPDNAGCQQCFLIFFPDTELAGTPKSAPRCISGWEIRIRNGFQNLPGY